MWVQGLALLCGAAPRGRVDGMCAGLGSRGGRRAVTPLPEELHRTEVALFGFLELLG